MASDFIIARLYEDYVLGNLNQDRYRKMSADYEAEQERLKLEIEVIEEWVEQREEMNDGLDAFIALTQKYVDVEELTQTIVNEYIKKIVVYAPETTLKYIEPLRRKQTATVETVLFKDWEKLPALLRELRTDDCLWLVMSRRERISYQPAMNKIPAYLDQYLGRNSFVLIYPVQAGDTDNRYL